MIALDASILIAHLSSFDVHHAEATNILLKAVAEPMLVHGLTLAEVLVGGARVGKGAEMLADLIAVGIQVAGRDEDEPLRLAQLRVTTGLKLPDCCVLDAAITPGSELATFDRALSNAARQLGVAVVPD